MTACDLHDMKSNGRFYTWNNKQDGNKRVFSKIERALCNDPWYQEYPNSEVTFLPEGTLTIPLS